MLSSIVPGCSVRGCCEVQVRGIVQGAAPNEGLSQRVLAASTVDSCLIRCPRGTQDGCEVAASLGDAAQAASVPWADVPALVLESVLRDFERRRSTRCAPLVARARANGRRFVAKRTGLMGWLVRCACTAHVCMRGTSSSPGACILSCGACGVLRGTHGMHDVPKGHGACGVKSYHGVREPGRRHLLHQKALWQHAW